MSDFSTLGIELDPRGIATLWLDRAATHNAFNALMINELIAALKQLQANETLRILLVRGRGKHFCAGADVAWMRDAAGLTYAANLHDAHLLGELLERLYHLSIPTLAVVHGAAFGGGFGLVACCDMAIGSVDAQFCLSEVRIGLVPAVISPYVVQAMGERASRRYALTAERFNGERARELGLLAECYPAGELDAAVKQWVANFLLNGPQAMRVAKALFQEVGSGVLSAELRARTEGYIAGVRVSDEGQEGLQAFLEKRAASWVWKARSSHGKTQ